MVKIQRLSGEDISIDVLTDIGVIYKNIEPSDFTPLEELCKERGYKNRDEVFISTSDEHKKEDQTFHCDKQIILTKEVPGLNLKEKLDIFFEEHLHEDEEIRYVIDGAGRFDIRDKNDEWVKIIVEKGDLIIVPENKYHRFCLDESPFIHAMRLFKDAPKWIAIKRET